MRRTPDEIKSALNARRTAMTKEDKSRRSHLFALFSMLCLLVLSAGIVVTAAVMSRSDPIIPDPLPGNTVGTGSMAACTTWNAMVTDGWPESSEAISHDTPTTASPNSPVGGDDNEDNHTRPEAPTGTMTQITTAFPSEANPPTASPEDDLLKKILPDAVANKNPDDVLLITEGDPMKITLIDPKNLGIGIGDYDKNVAGWANDTALRQIEALVRYHNDIVSVGVWTDALPELVLYQNKSYFLCTVFLACIDDTGRQATVPLKLLIATL